MQLECTVLGKDIDIADTSIPVVSPYWRLKRSGDWALLCRYEAEQIYYSILSPPVGATLSLMDGGLTFRHLCLIVQYAHGFEDLEKAREFVSKVILKVNRQNDAIVDMRPELEPYLKRTDPSAFADNSPRWKEQKRPAAPISLNLMFSNDCETNCTHCQVHRRYVPESQLLTTKRWRELLREAKALGIDQVTLSGGDPLFRRDALALIAELINQEMLFKLPTKCYITKEIADRLVEIGMTKPVNQYMREMELSVDGPDEINAERVSCALGTSNRAAQSIRNLLERRFNLLVKAVVTPLNASHIYSWIEQLVGLGVTRIALTGYSRTYHSNNDNVLLSEEARISISRQCERAKADFPEIDLTIAGQISLRDGVASATARSADTEPLEIELENEQSLNDKIRRWKKRAQCSGGRSSMTITPDGKVVLCDTVPQEEVFFVGDVSKQSIIEVWNSETLLDFAYPPRERFKGSPCYDCKDLEECQSKAGYCFRDSYFSYGTVFAPPPMCPMAQATGQ